MNEKCEKCGREKHDCISGTIQNCQEREIERLKAELDLLLSQVVSLSRGEAAVDLWRAMVKDLHEQQYIVGKLTAERDRLKGLLEKAKTIIEAFACTDSQDTVGSVSCELKTHHEYPHSWAIDAAKEWLKALK